MGWLYYAYALFLFPLAGIAGWYAFFKLPLGRRNIKASLLIKAPRDVVWQRIDPRNLDYDWIEHSETRDAHILHDDPLTVELYARARGQSVEFNRVECTFPEIVRGFRVVECTVAMGDEPIPVANLFFETTQLADRRAGTLVTRWVQQPVQGLLGLELARKSGSRHLRALNAAVMQTAGGQPPLFEFTGWRIALGSFLATVAMMMLLAFNPRTGWSGILIPCGVALILEAVTFLHEMGHALALAAFGHRNIVVSLIPFFGGFAGSKRKFSSAFEAGMVALAGPGICALAGLLCLPFADGLARDMAMLFSGDSVARAGITANGAILFWVKTGGFSIVMAMVGLNMINLLPWPGSDGDIFLRSFFRDDRLRRGAILVFGAGVLFHFRGFVGVSGLLPVIAAGYFLFGKKPAVAEMPAATRRERYALASAFVLVLTSYSLESRAVTHAFGASGPAAQFGSGSSEQQIDIDDDDAPQPQPPAARRL